MMMRIASIWISVLLASLCSFLCFVVAQEIGAVYEYITGGAELPTLSKLYYPGAMAIYWHPIIPAIWASHATFNKASQEHAFLLVTSTLVLVIAFAVGWVCGMALPYTSILVLPISG
jgi:hypothetical protein